METDSKQPFETLSSSQLADIRDRLSGIHVVGFEFRDERGIPGIGEIGADFWEPLRVSPYVTLVNLCRQIKGERGSQSG